VAALQRLLAEVLGDHRLADAARAERHDVDRVVEER
jgi:hypothetical protein